MPEQSISPTSVSIRISTTTRELAQRHYQRAQEQIKRDDWGSAIQELRDAIKLDPNNSSYHALLGQVQLGQGRNGLATISLRQALKLNSEEPIALECMQKINQIQAADKANAAPDLASRFLGFFGVKK